MCRVLSPHAPAGICTAPPQVQRVTSVPAPAAPRSVSCRVGVAPPPNKSMPSEVPSYGAVVTRDTEAGTSAPPEVATPPNIRRVTSAHHISP